MILSMIFNIVYILLKIMGADILKCDNFIAMITVSFISRFLKSYLTNAALLSVLWQFESQRFCHYCVILN